MKEKKIIKKLEQSLKEKRYIRLKTWHPDKDTYSGVVIHLGDGYLAMRIFDDFTYDGIEIFPISSIKGFHDSKYQRIAQEIITANGDLDDLRVPEWLADCPRIGDVIVKLHQNNIWPGIEEVYLNKSSSFYLGPITKVKKNTFRIKCYDAAGKWDKKYKRQYDWIFRISIDGAYTNRFNAYMRAKDAAAAVQD